MTTETDGLIALTEALWQDPGYVRRGADTLFESGKERYKEGNFGMARFFFAMAGHGYRRLENNFYLKILTPWYILAAKATGIDPKLPWE